MKKVTSKKVTGVEPPVMNESSVPAVVVPRPTALATANEMTVSDLLAQVQKIQEVMKAAMKEGEHYGVIPGTNKPSLLKPGAEKLLLLFRLAPAYTCDTLREGDHVTITSTCTLRHIPTDRIWGSGMGSCSTRESRYAYRNSNRKCPKCGKEAIIKGKEEYGGGWVCFKKKDGCGAKFADADKAITDQVAGRADNPDMADQYNTVLKMANKRSLVAAILNVTAASDIFTQDMEDHAAEPAPDVHTREAVGKTGASEKVNGDTYTREPVENGRSMPKPVAAKKLREEKPTLTETHKKLWRVMKAVGYDTDKAYRNVLADTYGVESTHQLTEEQAAEVTERIKAWARAKEAGADV